MTEASSSFSACAITLLSTSLQRIHLCEPCWQLGLKEVWLHALPVPLQHLAIAPDHKLCEVPFDGTVPGSTKRSTTQKFVDFLGVRSVYISSFHQGRCRPC